MKPAKARVKKKIQKLATEENSKLANIDVRMRSFDVLRAREAQEARLKEIEEDRLRRQS